MQLKIAFTTLCLIFSLLGFSANKLADSSLPLVAITSEEAPSNQPAEPFPDNGMSYEAAFTKTLFVLIGILAAIFIAFFLFKKFSSGRLTQTNSLRNIKILEKRAISPKTMLYLIEIGGKQLLIGESQLELRNLSDLDWIELPKQGL